MKRDKESDWSELSHIRNSFVYCGQVISHGSLMINKDFSTLDPI
jgi:hypothetical protein